MITMEINLNPTIPRLITAAAFTLMTTTSYAQSSLPDPKVTPGAVDPRVTQQNLHQTVCVPGYSKSVRPPSSDTDRWKRNALRLSGYLDQSISHYEWDHKIPIEVGGSPTSLLNQWLEYRYPDDGWDVALKDKFENEMHRRLCSGQISLSEAQEAFAGDWRAAYNHYVIGAD
jgi:hypothetical protein